MASLGARRLAAGGGERARIAAMVAVIGLLHLVGWLTLILVVAPRNLGVGTRTFGVGIGATAYALGMRHAFDADHIAAIDNATRKLIADGRRPHSVGLWFSLGHSSVVFALALLLAVGLDAIAGPLIHGGSGAHSATVTAGTAVSGIFLYAIAAMNLAVLAGVWRIFRRMRSGAIDDAALEAQLGKRGFVSRLAGRLAEPLGRPRRMFLVGLLFGLGFDTASEIALLVLAGSGAASGLPWYAILCLPVLFAAGMSLLDTVDGSLMSSAYGWAQRQPVRRVYFNLTITGLSVAVALVVGTVELFGLLAPRLELHGGVWAWISAPDMSAVGLLIAGTLIAAWVVSILVWRWGRIEERWAPAAERERLPEAEA